MFSEKLKLCICKLVISEELKLCMCRLVITKHKSAAHGFNSSLSTVSIIYIHSFSSMVAVKLYMCMPLNNCLKSGA